MKNVMFGSLCLLILCKFSVHSFCYAENAPQKVSPTHSPPPLEAISDELWAVSLSTFEERLKTDLKAARAELQNVSKKLFNGHLLTEEWVPLYFRIRHKGTQHPSDVKRLAELEIRMLTAIAMETGDFQKHALQLQRLQEAYQKYEDWEKAQQNHSHSHEPNHTSEPQTGNSSRGADRKAGTDESHAQNSETDLKTLFETDQEAARAELLPLMATEFNNHPRSEEMIDTLLAFFAKKRVSYPELIALMELQLQILKHGDTEKYKEHIQGVEKGLKKLRNISKLLEKQGSLETDTIKLSFEFQGFLPKKGDTPFSEGKSPKE